MMQVIKLASSTEFATKIRKVSNFCTEVIQVGGSAHKMLLLCSIMLKFRQESYYAQNYYAGIMCQGLFPGSLLASPKIMQD